MIKLKIYRNKLMYGILFLVFLGMIFLLRMHTSNDNYRLVMVLYSVNFIYLIIKLSLALLYTPHINTEKEFKISVIIPSFNEDKDSVLKAISTLVKQTYPIHEIIFIDDGSDSEEAYLAVRHLRIDRLKETNKVNKTVKLTSLRLAQNSGKKKAQEVGFIQATGELFLLVDSDGEITENTLAEMVKPFSNPKVGSVVGKIEVRNLTDSFWTRLQDIIYSNSFQVGRASQSKTGNVIVCSGALSMHRANFVKRNMRTFRKETFLGIPCSAGDDRLLTDISLERNYKTVYQSTAVCYTDVPKTLRTFFKQQVRWTKSALIMTLFSFRYCFIRPLSMIWQLLETYLWLYNFCITINLLLQGKVGIGIEIALAAFIYFILVGYLSNIFYTTRNVKTYLLTFIYSFVYSVLLVGIRLYSLVTIFKTGWTTR